MGMGEQLFQSLLDHPEGLWIGKCVPDDNLSALRLWVPKLRGPLVGTTQGRPLENVFNFGGFTDGDRAAHLVHELGASAIELYGFDFFTPGPNTPKERIDNKKQKLMQLKLK